MNFDFFCDVLKQLVKNEQGFDRLVASFPEFSGFVTKHVENIPTDVVVVNDWVALMKYKSPITLRHLYLAGEKGSIECVLWFVRHEAKRCRSWKFSLDAVVTKLSNNGFYDEIYRLFSETSQLNTFSGFWDFISTLQHDAKRFERFVELYSKTQRIEPMDRFSLMALGRFDLLRYLGGATEADVIASLAIQTLFHSKNRMELSRAQTLFEMLEPKKLDELEFHVISHALRLVLDTNRPAKKNEALRRLQRELVVEGDEMDGKVAGLIFLQSLYGERCFSTFTLDAEQMAVDSFFSGDVVSFVFVSEMLFPDNDILERCDEIADGVIEACPGVKEYFLIKIAHYNDPFDMTDIEDELRHSFESAKDREPNIDEFRDEYPLIDQFWTLL